MIGHTFKQKFSMASVSVNECKLKQTCIGTKVAWFLHMCKILNKHVLLILEVHIQGKSNTFKLQEDIKKFKSDFLPPADCTAAKLWASIRKLKPQAPKSLSYVWSPSLWTLRNSKSKPPNWLEHLKSQASELASIWSSSLQTVMHLKLAKQTTSS